MTSPSHMNTATRYATPGPCSERKLYLVPIRNGKIPASACLSHSVSPQPFVFEHRHSLPRIAGSLTTKSSRLFQGYAQELQAEVNQELLEKMHDAELEDWGRRLRVSHGGLRPNRECSIALWRRNSPTTPRPSAPWSRTTSLSGSPYSSATGSAIRYAAVSASLLVGHAESD